MNLEDLCRTIGNQTFRFKIICPKRHLVRWAEMKVKNGGLALNFVSGSGGPVDIAAEWKLVTGGMARDTNRWTLHCSDATCSYAPTVALPQLLRVCTSAYERNKRVIRLELR